MNDYHKIKDELTTAMHQMKQLIDAENNKNINKVEEKETTLKNWHVLLVIIIAITIAGVFAMFMPSVLMTAGEYKVPINKFIFNDHILTFNIDSPSNTYKVLLPLDTDVKKEDKVEVIYKKDRGKIKDIIAIHVNDKSVNDGSYSLFYTEIINN